jgi:hypothetical protein
MATTHRLNPRRRLAKDDFAVELFLLDGKEIPADHPRNKAVVVYRTND